MCFKYLLKSSQLSQIKSKGVERLFKKIIYKKKVSNLNHNGALLPKIENQDEFFNILEKFKKCFKKKIKKNTLIHFPIIVRLNNTLADPNKKYSASHPHYGSWAGQPENQKSYHLTFFLYKENTYVRNIVLKNNKKISLSKKKNIKVLLNLKDFKSLYKTQKADLCIFNAGALHRTSKGKKFRIKMECRFIEKRKN